MTVTDYINRNLSDMKRVAAQAAWRYHTDPEDLFQNAVINAIRFQHKYNDKDGLKGFLNWFSFIVKNQFIDQYRKESRIPVMASVDHPAIGNNGPRTHPHNRFEDREKLALLYRMIRKKFGYKASLLLYLRAKGYKYHQIADHFGQPLGTMKAHFFRIREYLKESPQLRNAA